MGGLSSREDASFRTISAGIPSHYEIDLSGTTTSNGPLSYDALMRATRSICYLHVRHNDPHQQDQAPGLAVTFTANNKTVCGILTCNNTSLDLIGTPLTLHYPTRPDMKPITIKDPICSFTCPMLNITFIQVREDLVQDTKDQECFFCDLQQQQSFIHNSTPLYILSEPHLPTIKYTCARSKEYYGQDLLYYIDNSCSSIIPALPVVTLTGQLVALHKGIQKEPEYMYIGISSNTILSALQQCYMLTTTPRHITSNPLDTSSYEGKLEENGLDVLHLSEDNRFKGCTMYISPASPFVTPIWFMPTYLGWYWTPTDPNGQEYPNWMSVNRLEVIGGDWHGQIPAPNNITIIRWLSQNNIDKIILS